MMIVITFNIQNIIIDYFLVTMAPEVYNTTKYDEKCDIYSWSIVFWQLLSKQILPYGNQNMSMFERLFLLVDKTMFK